MSFCRLFGLSLLIIYAVASVKAASTSTASPVFNLGTCRTPDNDNGLCVRIDDCEYLLEMLKENGTEKRNYLKDSQCGLDNTNTDLLKRIMVCCADKRDIRQPNPGIREIPTPNSNLLPNTTICGNVLTDRILGGQVTQLDEFPWMALLSYKKPFNNFGFHCGGALINSRYVITAAHCVVSPDMPESWSLHSVRLGEWDTTKNPDCRVDKTGKETCALPHVDVEIEKRIAHELYLPQSIDQFHDIALLRLVKNVVFTKYVTPICLPLETEVRTNMFHDTAMDVAGWGVTENETPSAQKLKIEVDVWNVTHCQNTYRSYQVHINGSQLCAGGKEGIDTCRGDSGGPLMVQEQVGGFDRYFVAGIVSYGPKPCGLPGWPGVYTRVGFYINWIVANLAP